LDHLKQWFSRYVQSFYSADPVVQEGLVLKEKHSFRVCDEILNIGRKLDLSKNNLRLAEVMALFHDIGRFEQFAHHKTFVDKNQKTTDSWASKVLEHENALAALPADARELNPESIPTITV